jgi:hypothetical protein
MAREEIEAVGEVAAHADEGIATPTLISARVQDASYGNT